LSAADHNPYFERIAGEWRSRARELAQWSMQYLVNRRDVWGKYTGRTEGPNRAVTAPFREERGKVVLEMSSLEKHFKARNRRALMGLHSTSSHYSAQWMVIDLDQHDDGDAEQVAAANFVAATTWLSQLQRWGFDPLLLDSNGRGGYHLLTIFAEPMDAGLVHAMGEKLTADFARLGVDEQPEIFPGEGRSRRYGNWLRLPGLHHTHAHYTRVYNDDAWDEDKWLEGEEAIDRMLQTAPAPVELLAKQGVTHRRSTVCLDFDGVLHAYTSGWRGIATIADEPVHGAARAVAKLRERYRVVVHSARCRTEEGRTAISHWLARHSIEVDEVCEHKPPAIVYLDDRGVRFTGDWEQAIADINNPDVKPEKKP